MLFLHLANIFLKVVVVDDIGLSQLELQKISEFIKGRRGNTPKKQNPQMQKNNENNADREPLLKKIGGNNQDNRRFTRPLQNNMRPSPQQESNNLRPLPKQENDSNNLRPVPNQNENQENDNTRPYYKQEKQIPEQKESNTTPSQRQNNDNLRPAPNQNDNQEKNNAKPLYKQENQIPEQRENSAAPLQRQNNDNLIPPPYQNENNTRPNQMQGRNIPDQRENDRSPSPRSSYQPQDYNRPSNRETNSPQRPEQRENAYEPHDYNQPQNRQTNLPQRPERRENAYEPYGYNQPQNRQTNLPQRSEHRENDMKPLQRQEIQSQYQPFNTREDIPRRTEQDYRNTSDNNQFYQPPYRLNERQSDNNNGITDDSNNYADREESRSNKPRWSKRQNPASNFTDKRYEPDILDSNNNAYNETPDYVQHTSPLQNIKTGPHIEILTDDPSFQPVRRSRNIPTYSINDDLHQNSLASHNSLDTPNTSNSLTVPELNIPSASNAEDSLLFKEKGNLIDAAMAHKSLLDIKLNKSAAKEQSVDEEIDNVASRLEQIEEKLKETKENYSVIKSNIAYLKKKKVSINTNKRQLKLDHDKTEASIRLLQSEITHLMKRLDTLRSKIATVEGEKNVFATRIHDLDKEIVETQKMIDVEGNKFQLRGKDMIAVDNIYNRLKLIMQELICRKTKEMNEQERIEQEKKRITENYEDYS